MSEAVLLLAKREHLRSNLGPIIPGGSERAAFYIDITPGGRPPPSMGDWFIGLDGNGVSSGDLTFLKEIFTTVAVITLKNIMPKDRQDSVYLATGSGLDAIERAVIGAVHGNQLLRQRANALAGIPTDQATDPSKGDIFQKALYYTGRGPSEPENGEWIGGEPDRGAFLIRRLNFVGGNRIQALDIMH